MATAQLQVMVKNLRAECGHSLSVAQGVNNAETLKYLLSRTQEELWTAFVWPELKLRVAISLATGQYSYPYHADMPYDCIRETWTAPAGSAEGTHWTPVEYGIDVEDMILPDGTNSERDDPPVYWDADGPANFRIWPTPNTSTRLRFVGQKRLNPLVADSDVSDARRDRHRAVYRRRPARPRQGRGRADQDAEGAAAPDQAARQQGQRQNEGGNAGRRLAQP